MRLWNRAREGWQRTPPAHPLESLVVERERIHTATSEQEGDYTKLKAATVRISYLEAQLELMRTVSTEASKAVASIDAYRYAAEQNQDRYYRAEARIKDLETQLALGSRMLQDARLTLTTVQELGREILVRLPSIKKRKRRARHTK